MRSLIWIVLIGFFFSCANSNNEPAYKEAISEITESDDVELVLEELSIEDLTSQKLVDYYDLLRLKDKHPEFNKDIVTQLRNLSDLPLHETNKLTVNSIGNIRQIGQVEQVSDSVQKVKLLYDVFTENKHETDSIYAIVTSKVVTIEKIITKSTNVVFERI